MVSYFMNRADLVADFSEITGKEFTADKFAAFMVEQARAFLLSRGKQRESKPGSEEDETS